MASYKTSTYLIRAKDKEQAKAEGKSIREVISEREQAQRSSSSSSSSKSSTPVKATPTAAAVVTYVTSDPTYKGRTPTQAIEAAQKGIEVQPVKETSPILATPAAKEVLEEARPYTKYMPIATVQPGQGISQTASLQYKTKVVPQQAQTIEQAQERGITKAYIEGDLTKSQYKKEYAAIQTVKQQKKAIQAQEQARGIDVITKAQFPGISSVSARPTASVKPKDEYKLSAPIIMKTTSGFVQPSVSETIRKQTTFFDPMNPKNEKRTLPTVTPFSIKQEMPFLDFSQPRGPPAPTNVYLFGDAFAPKPKSLGPSVMPTFKDGIQTTTAKGSMIYDFSKIPAGYNILEAPKPTAGILKISPLPTVKRQISQKETIRSTPNLILGGMQGKVSKAAGISMYAGALAPSPKYLGPSIMPTFKAVKEPIKPDLFGDAFAPKPKSLGPSVMPTFKDGIQTTTAKGSMIYDFSKIPAGYNILAPAKKTPGEVFGPPTPIGSIPQASRISSKETKRMYQERSSLQILGISPYLTKDAMAFKTFKQSEVEQRALEQSPGIQKDMNLLSLGYWRSASKTADINIRKLESSLISRVNLKTDPIGKASTEYSLFGARKETVTPGTGKAYQKRVASVQPSNYDTLMYGATGASLLGLGVLSGAKSFVVDTVLDPVGTAEGIGKSIVTPFRTAEQIGKEFSYNPLGTVGKIGTMYAAGKFFEPVVGRIVTGQKQTPWYVKPGTKPNATQTKTSTSFEYDYNINRPYGGKQQDWIKAFIEDTHTIEVTRVVRPRMQVQITKGKGYTSTQLIDMISGKTVSQITKGGKTSVIKTQPLASGKVATSIKTSYFADSGLVKSYKPFSNVVNVPKPVVTSKTLISVPGKKISTGFKQPTQSDTFLQLQETKSYLITEGFYKKGLFGKEKFTSIDYLGATQKAVSTTSPQVTTIAEVRTAAYGDIYKQAVKPVSTTSLYPTIQTGKLTAPIDQTLILKATDLQLGNLYTSEKLVAGITAPRVFAETSQSMISLGIMQTGQKQQSVQRLIGSLGPEVPKPSKLSLQERRTQANLFYQELKGRARTGQLIKQIKTAEAKSSIPEVLKFAEQPGAKQSALMALEPKSKTTSAVSIGELPKQKKAVPTRAAPPVELYLSSGVTIPGIRAIPKQQRKQQYGKIIIPRYQSELAGQRDLIKVGDMTNIKSDVSSIMKMKQEPIIKQRMRQGSALDFVQKISPIQTTRSRQKQRQSQRQMTGQTVVSMGLGGFGSSKARAKAPPTEFPGIIVPIISKPKIEGGFPKSPKKKRALGFGLRKFNIATPKRFLLGR